ncbi:hypothetical protein [Streptomyces alkaliterrae]|uniref:Uncharacterized protein n=1 Tax=Streptomyces alkaliterrae TaxID=2213162 RepID=A0A7W3ZSE5_9ACTN|nr:hypothetical protein [Streptomyces alkaliterrae]MBB1258685.1 hypothetical protein [Streptomyces alkaliterrae]
MPTYPQYQPVRALRRCDRCGQPAQAARKVRGGWACHRTECVRRDDQEEQR